MAAIWRFVRVADAESQTSSFDEGNRMASELIVGLFFLIMGATSLTLNKSGARLFSEYQKHFGWERSTYTFGRVLHIVGGILGLLLGFMMLFAARS